MLLPTTFAEEKVNQMWCGGFEKKKELVKK